MNAPLEKLVENLPRDTPLKIFAQGLEKLGYSSSLIEPLSTRKGVFPYTYISSAEKLTEKQLPPRSAFFNDIKNEECSIPDYAFAQKMFKLANCQNLGDYMRLYLISDVLLLSEVFERTRTVFISQYQLDPVKILTLPSYALQAALLESKTSMELLDDIENYELFEDNILGGLTTLVDKHAKFNNKYVHDYNPDEEVSCGGFFDLNSLYSSAMSEALPIGDFTELKPEEVSNFDVKNTDIKGQFYYCMTVSAEIDPNVQDETDDLPLSLSSKKIDLTQQSPYNLSLIDKLKYSYVATKNLVATHEPMKERLISLERLQLFMKLGLRLTKIHSIYRFKQTNIFSQFIKKNIELRKNSVNSFDRDLYKLINNSIYEKLLYNARKHDLENKIVCNQQTFERLVKDPFLHSVDPIEKGKIVMRFNAKKIELKYPLYCGWAVLEKSKCIMYDMFYNKLRKAYGPSTKLLYSDTDSFLIRIPNIHSFLERVNHPSLKGYVDTSNFQRSILTFQKNIKENLELSSQRLNMFL